ncbi:MAG: hypothetical protein GC189_03170 [Alphaproteobacteria bacterium]|nr:hypothetical protein [Alphaproteobacteria bacterium]
MGRLALVCDVVLASPGDIRDDIAVVERAIVEWNAVNASSSVQFRPRRWERDVVLAWGGAPQECINTELVDEADGMIALLWHRYGTPTAASSSGTAEEIERFSSRGKRPAVYRCTRSYPTSVDPAQLECVREYESALARHGLVFKYDNDDDLNKLCFRYLSNLAHLVLQRYSKNPDPSEFRGGWAELGDQASLVDALEQMVYYRRQFELLAMRVQSRDEFDPELLTPFASTDFSSFAINFEELVLRLPEVVHIQARQHLVRLSDLRAFAARPILSGGLTLKVACADLVPQIVDQMLAVEDLVRDALGCELGADAA